MDDECSADSEPQAAPPEDLAEARAFGVDPPRCSATAAQAGARCAVCWEEHVGPLEKLCWNPLCTSTFCSQCIANFASEAVERAMYAVPVLKCPGCRSRIPTAAWAEHAQQAHDMYQKNAEALLTFRCSSCHDMGTLLPVYSCIPDVIEAYGLERARHLHAAWPQFAEATLSADDFLELLQDEDPEDVIASIADVERRACLQLAWLRKNPFVYTPCCSAEFCFRCKVASFHSESTCEERQREELDIHCQFCPECEVPTVRAEGCDHIACVCGADWTWQDSVEAGYALGPPHFLRERLENGELNPSWAAPESEEAPGRTLLMYTCLEGRIRNAKLLLQAQADVHARDAVGHTAMLYAFGLVAGQYNPELVTLLQQYGGAVEKADVFLWVRSSSQTSAAALRKLLDLAQIDATAMHEGRSLLQLALQAGRSRLVGELLDMLGHRVDKQAPFWFVKGPLHDQALFSKVLRASCHPVDEPLVNQTLLQIAMMRSKDMAQHLILSHEAAATFEDVSRPAGTWWQDGTVVPEKVFNALLERGADPWQPLVDRDKVLISLLVRAIAHPHRSPLSETARRAAQAATARQIEQVLRRWSSRASAFAQGRDGSALLAEAARCGLWSVVVAFAEAGAPLEARDNPANSVLLVALNCLSINLRGFEEWSALEAILCAKADVLVEDAQGRTPLSIAKQMEWPEAVNALERAMDSQQSRQPLQDSGDGVIENVGLRPSGSFPCPHCFQRFDTKFGQATHVRFVHEQTL